MRPVDNPKQRFEPAAIEWEPGEAPLAALHVHEEQAKSLVAQNDSPDLPFRFSVNPYRGCQHACAYCYARPSHQYWGFGAGTDFEREIVVKVNAVPLLRRELRAPKLHGATLAFSGNTDCYQPLEGRYRLTRELLAVCAERASPVVMITKSVLVLRDLDVLLRLAQRAELCVYVSLAFADEAAARALEPGAPPPHRRIDTLRALSAAGIETGVAVAPIIPGLNDRDVPRVLELAAEAGATRAFHTLLRLPGEVREVFGARLRESLPLAAERVLSAQRELRGGRDDDSRFFSRMRGQGPRWHAIDALFQLQCKRLGLRTREPERQTFEAPSGKPKRQLELF